MLARPRSGPAVGQVQEDTGFGCCVFLVSIPVPVRIDLLRLEALSDAHLSGNQHGPPLVRKLSRRLTSRLTAWQNVVITLLWLYFARNFGKLVGLECPEPLANLYSRSYFRATWVTTALD